jgi:hypothetical protein
MDRRIYFLQEGRMKKNQFMVAVLTFCCLTLIVIPAARATDGQIKVGQPAAGESYPIVIDHAGSYVLTDNLVCGNHEYGLIITSTANFAIKNTGGGNTPDNIPPVPPGNFVPLTGDNANVFF